MTAHGPPLPTLATTRPTRSPPRSFSSNASHRWAPLDSFFDGSRSISWCSGSPQSLPPSLLKRCSKTPPASKPHRSSTDSKAARKLPNRLAQNR